MKLGMTYYTIHSLCLHEKENTIKQGPTFVKATVTLVYDYGLIYGVFWPLFDASVYPRSRSKSTQKILKQQIFYYHKHTYTRIPTYLHTYTHTHDTHTHTHIHTCMHACMHSYLPSLDTRLNTFGFLYIACSLIMLAVFTTESSLVLNFHTRCLFLVWLNNHKRIQQCCHLANLKGTIMT